MFLVWSEENGNSIGYGDEKAISVLSGQPRPEPVIHMSTTARCTFLFDPAVSGAYQLTTEYDN